MTKGSGLQSGRACLAGRIIALRCPFFQHKMSGSQKTDARPPPHASPRPGGCVPRSTGRSFGPYEGAASRRHASCRAFPPCVWPRPSSLGPPNEKRPDQEPESTDRRHGLTAPDAYPDSFIFTLQGTVGSFVADQTYEEVNRNPRRPVKRSRQSRPSLASTEKIFGSTDDRIRNESRGG